jgi:hypothetical protein
MEGESLVGQTKFRQCRSADQVKVMAGLSGAESRAAGMLAVKIVDQIRYSGSWTEIFGSLQSIVRAVGAVESAWHASS